MVTVQEAQKEKQAMDKFIEENLKLVYTSMKQMSLNVHSEDHFQVGCIGLVKAAKYFKPEFGTAFSTYAIPMITGEIQRYRRDFEADNGGLSIPRSIKDIYFRSRKLEDICLNDEEICKQLEITQQALDEARLAMSINPSLNAEIENDKDGSLKSLADIIPMNYNLQDVVTEKLQNEGLLLHLISYLKPTQIKVLKLHLDGLTQNEIAQKVGISQAHVARTIRKIIEKGQSVAEGRLPMKITKDQLINECRIRFEHHGNITQQDFMEIAQKYCMTKGSVECNFYKWRVKEALNADPTFETKIEKHEPVKPEPMPERILKAKSEPIPEPKTEGKPANKSCLKAMSWAGKECKYSFNEAGELVIISGDGNIVVTDYSALIQEIQELTELRKAI